MEKFSLDRAQEIAQKAHAGQVDKAGVEYINHPMTVMQTVNDPDAKIVAMLHDVVEDSPATFEDFTSMGCPPHIIDALRLVTHPEDFDGTEESYIKEIQKIADSQNQLAIDVKFADLTHNSDQTRIENPTEKDFKRWAKYHKAKEMLRPLVSEYLREL